MSAGPESAGVGLVEDYRATAAGFLGAAVVLAVLLWVVGVGEVLAAARRADLVVLVGVLGAALAWLLCWGLALRTVLASLGIGISVGQAFLVFSAATFANNVTPFGQAGGEPVSAYLVSSVADSEYETGLAAIATVDALHFLPSIGLAAVGLGYFATTVALGDRLAVAAVAVGAVAVGVLALAVAVWRFRERVEETLAAVLTPLLAVPARLLPGREPPTRAAVVERIDAFFGTLETIADDRRRVAIALAFSTLGWLGLATALWLAILSLSDPVVFAAVVLAVPLGSIASVTPLPGGLGGIETVLIAVLAPTTALTPEVATAAVLLHRGATYWLPVLVGGGAASALGAAGRE